MKQTTIKLLCAGLLSMAAACSNDPATETPAPEGQLRQMSFTATNATTRTELTEGNAVHWQADDRIAVYPAVNGNNNTSSKSFKTDESGATVTFTGEIAPAEKYWALYPESVDNGFWEGNGITLKMKGTQVATSGSFDPAANLAFAESTDGKTFRFENLCGLIKFRRPTESQREIVSVTLRGNNGEPLTSTMFNPWNKTFAPNGVDQIVLEGGIGTGTDYYFVVRPVELTQGFSLTFLGTDNAEYTITGSKPASIKAGHILNLGTLDTDAVVKDFDYDYETNTFTVYTELGLRNWAAAVALKQYEINGAIVDMTKTNCRLGADIELTQEWKSVGVGSLSRTDLSYGGSFDGRGHTISGLKLTEATMAYSAEPPYAGFFGVLDGATVRDVTFESPSITDGTAAVVAGRTKNTTIENCHVKNATVIGNYSRSGTPRFAADVGGIVAYAEEETSILGCSVTGSISSRKITSGTSGVAGGIVGEAGAAVISGCYFNGSVTTEAKSNGVGGIVGTSKASIYGCASAGKLTTTASSYCGGIIGKATSSNVYGSYSTCTCEAPSDGGALFGNNNLTFEACFTTNTAVDAVWGKPEYNETCRTDDISSKLDEMNAAIPEEYGWKFAANTGEDQNVLPLKPVKR